MDEYTTDALVNRDEPVPVLRVPARDTSNTPSPLSPSSVVTSTTLSPDDDEAVVAAAGGSTGKRDRLKGSFANATSRLKDKVQESVGGSNKEYGYSLQDRLFTK